MRIIAIGLGNVAADLAVRLGLPVAGRVHDIESDDFVLDGSQLGLADARALDAVLRARAAEVDAVLWLGGGDPEVVGHYFGRVVDLDPEDPLDSALAGLREVLLVS